MSDSYDRRFPKVTEGALDDLRKRVGVKIENTLEPWCHEATRDNIRHYAHGIGDDNPLWCDPDYAKQTEFGDVVALPSFLFSCSRIISGYVGGLPGVHAMWAGADWTWHNWVRRNDEIKTEAWLKDLIVHDTRFSGRAVQQIYHVNFYNQDGDLLSEADSWCFRTDRDFAREEGTKYEALKEKEPRRYTPEELSEIYSLYNKEEVRGATPRYWEDVSVGDELPTMAKGPMTVTGFICYAQGWGGLYIRANKIAWKQIDKHPGLGIENKFGIPDCPERVHWENDFAAEVGAPGANGDRLASESLEIDLHREIVAMRAVAVCLVPVPDGVLGQSLRLLEHDELRVLDATTLTRGSSDNRIKRAASILALGWSSRLPAWPRGYGGLAEADPRDENAALALLVWRRVDVALA